MRHSRSAPAAASVSSPDNRPRSDCAAPAARARSASSGEISSQTPGIARATKAGEKTKNDAVTTAALAGPSGAARPAKYPRQKPRRPACAKAERASGEKYVTAWIGSNSVHIDRALRVASAMTAPSVD